MGALFVISLFGVAAGIIRLIPELRDDILDDDRYDPEKLKKFNRNSIIILSLSIAIWVFLIFAPSSGALMYWFGMDSGEVWRILHPYR